MLPVGVTVLLNRLCDQSLYDVCVERDTNAVIANPIHQRFKFVPLREYFWWCCQECDGSSVFVLHTDKNIIVVVVCKLCEVHFVFFLMAYTPPFGLDKATSFRSGSPRSQSTACQDRFLLVCEPTQGWVCIPLCRRTWCLSRILGSRYETPL